eukprot:SAG11_NODE_2745_length_3018_cov_3.931141_1_plen_467_part_10
MVARAVLLSLAAVSVLFASECTAQIMRHPPAWINEVDLEGVAVALYPAARRGAEWGNPRGYLELVFKVQAREPIQPPESLHIEIYDGTQGSPTQNATVGSIQVSSLRPRTDLNAGHTLLAPSPDQDSPASCTLAECWAEADSDDSYQLGYLFLSDSNYDAYYRIGEDAGGNVIVGEKQYALALCTTAGDLLQYISFGGTGVRPADGCALGKVDLATAQQIGAMTTNLVEVQGHTSPQDSLGLVSTAFGGVGANYEDFQWAKLTGTGRGSHPGITYATLNHGIQQAKCELALGQGPTPNHGCSQVVGIVPVDCEGALLPRVCPDACQQQYHVTAWAANGGDACPHEDRAPVACQGGDCAGPTDCDFRYDTHQCHADCTAPVRINPPASNGGQPCVDPVTRVTLSRTGDATTCQPGEGDCPEPEPEPYLDFGWQLPSLRTCPPSTIYNRLNAVNTACCVQDDMPTCDDG